MTTALQKKVADAALKRIAEQATASSRSAEVRNEPQSLAEHISNSRTFVHQVAGANTILPDGRKLVFRGKKGSQGFYMTDDVDEIEWLEELVATPASQISEEINNRVVRKAVDPAIQEAAMEAAANSERAANPTVSAAVNNLPQAIAAATAAG